MCIYLTLLSDEDKFVLFVSRLKIGGHETNPLDLQLLVDHLTGHLSDEQVLSCLHAEFLTYYCSDQSLQQLLELPYVTMIAVH